MSDINTTDAPKIGNYALTAYLHHMPAYTAKVVIDNKPGLNDPEGTTILNDLILKGSNSKITAVRSAKLLYISISAKSAGDAKKNVKKMCDDMRIYNPVVSTVSISVESA